MNNRIDQHGSDVDGDQVAGNKTENHYYDYKKQPSYINKLMKEYEDDIKNNKKLSEYIREITHFLRDIDPTPKTLEDKLNSAGHKEKCNDALVLKEDFTKFLRRHQFSPSAQRIFVYLLGLIQEKFRSEIYPLLSKNLANKEIDAAISKHVIEPTLNILEENALHITVNDLRGMMYFLTGNCHLDWDK